MAGFIFRFASLFVVVEIAFAVTLRYNSTDEPLERIHVYIHVPKCAGSTFSKAMLPASKSKQWWPNDLRAAGCGKTFEEGGLNWHCGLSELETCIESGKAQYSALANVPASAPLRFIMMVRDPIQRVLSEYYFMKWFLYKGIVKPDIRLVNESLWTPAVKDIAVFGSVLDWVQAFGNPAHNVQTKYVLDGDAGLPAPALRQRPGHIPSCGIFDHADYVSHWRKFYGGNVGPDLEAKLNSDKKLLARAVHVIETRFDFVGLVEHFDESVSRLSRLLGVTVDGPATGKASASSAHRAIRKPAETDIPSDLIQEVQARNQLDIGLYAAVLKSKFWKDTAAAKNALGFDTSKRLTWETVIDESREDAVFDPSVLVPKSEAQ